MKDDYADAKARVLAILKREAPRFVSTWDLIHLTRHSRAAGRVWELKRDGYDIAHIHEGRTHFWAYRGEPQVRQPDLFQRSA
jgi:biotin operon repressor